MMHILFFFLFLTSSLISYEWNIIQLASYPRSGNHWVRFLVEEATLTTTSSSYKDQDFPHEADLFPWKSFSVKGGYRGNCVSPKKGSSVLVKTHYPLFEKAIYPEAIATICLIRNPIDAFYSYHTYKHKNRILPPFTYDLLINFINQWRAFYEFWECQPNTTIIRYEDLHSNPGVQLQTILSLAGFAFEAEDISRAVDLYPPQGKPYKHLIRFTKAEAAFIKSSLRDLLNRYSYDF